MGSGKVLPIRALPRFFIPGALLADGPVELGPEDWKKVHNVLRLSSGDQIAILPNDGSIWRCTLQGHSAVPVEQSRPGTESPRQVTLCVAYLKGEKLEDVIRRGSEIGVSEFVLFSADRSVVKWDAKKLADRDRRWQAIAREACELSYRTQLPSLRYEPTLKAVLQKYPTAQVLSEVESETQRMQVQPEMVLVVGPEGGWSPKEVELIGEKAITLGPRVLSADAAALSACALALLT